MGLTDKLQAVFKRGADADASGEDHGSSRVSTTTTTTTRTPAQAPSGSSDGDSEQSLPQLAMDWVKLFFSPSKLREGLSRGVGGSPVLGKRKLNEVDDDDGPGSEQASSKRRPAAKKPKTPVKKNEKTSVKSPSEYRSSPEPELDDSESEQQKTRSLQECFDGLIELRDKDPGNVITSPGSKVSQLNLFKIRSMLKYYELRLKGTGHIPALKEASEYSTQIMKEHNEQESRKSYQFTKTGYARVTIADWVKAYNHGTFKPVMIGKYQNTQKPRTRFGDDEIEIAHSAFIDCMEMKDRTTVRLQAIFGYISANVKNASALSAAEKKSLGQKISKTICNPSFNPEKTNDPVGLNLAKRQLRVWGMQPSDTKEFYKGEEYKNIGFQKIWVTNDELQKK